MEPDRTICRGLADIFDELREHRRRFLLAVIFSGLACSILFLQLGHFGVIPSAGPQIEALCGFLLLALPLGILLWLRPSSYTFVVWSYDAVTLMLFLAVLLGTPHNELRAIWFLLLVAGAFTLIGTIAGWMNVVVTLAAVITSHATGMVGYSTMALVTFTVCLLASGAFFHAANWQVASFVRRIDHTTRHLRRASHTDALTGLANNWAMADAWEELARSAEPVGFLFVDVDHFKAINDCFGHACGDLVLKTIADALKTNIGDKAVAGRIGGEEFAILLPGTHLEDAVRVAENIRTAVERIRPTIGGRTIDVTTSVGVAVSLAPHAQQSVVKREADAALYRAKQLGRNRVEAATAGAALTA